jgi:hypothetical protein
MASIKGQNVLETSFFEEDILAFDDQIKKTEELYTEVHGLYAEATSGDGGAPFKMLRDVSEIAKTLSSIRSSTIDGINKRFQAKRSISDLEQKKSQAADENMNMAEIARATVSAIRSELNLQKPVKSEIPKTSGVDKSALEKRVNGELTSEGIKLTENDKVMKYAFKGIEIVYNKKKKKFMALAKTGELLEDYPTDRVPDQKVVKEENGYVYTVAGSKYRVI